MIRDRGRVGARVRVRVRGRCVSELGLDMF